VANKILDKNEYETYILLSKALFYETSPGSNYNGLHYIFINNPEETSKLCHQFLNAFDEDRAFIHQIYWILKVFNEDKIEKEISKHREITIKKNILNFEITAIYGMYSYDYKINSFFQLIIEKIDIKKNRIVIFDSYNIDKITPSFSQELPYKTASNKYLNEMLDTINKIRICNITKDERVNIINILKDEFKRFTSDLIKAKKESEEELLRKKALEKLKGREKEKRIKQRKIDRFEEFKKSIDGAFDLDEEKNKILKTNKDKEAAKFDMIYKRYEAFEGSLKVFLSFVFLIGIALYFILKAIN
tara:strand:+ start:2118 stop:3026 length:909 start_codon:yes stop_codon:yes gene_type:complete